MIQTDILIIGAGPTGLFAVFEAGLLQLKCHIIDALPMPGGQLSELYPKKPIYDIPGFPEVLAGDLVDNLMEQIKPFEPGFTLGERAETIEKQADGSFIVTTDKGTAHHTKIVAIAGGLGSFEPKKPPIEGLERLEDKGVAYMIKDPEVYRDQKVLIAGGGDSALDWSIFLAEVASAGCQNFNATFTFIFLSFASSITLKRKMFDSGGQGIEPYLTECSFASFIDSNALRCSSYSHFLAVALVNIIDFCFDSAANC